MIMRTLRGTMFFCRSPSLMLGAVVGIMFVFQAPEVVRAITRKTLTTELDVDDNVPYWISLRPILNRVEVEKSEAAAKAELRTKTAAADSPLHGAVGPAANIEEATPIGATGSGRKGPAGGVGRSALIKAAEAAGGRKLNLLMVVLDDMRPDLAMWGHADAPATPRFKAFANQARVFRRAYAQFPDCAPSRQSFMTGLRPDNLGISSHDCSVKVHPGVECDFRKTRLGTVSIPEFFRKAGYVTLSFGKVFHQGLNFAPSWSPKEEWPNGFVRNPKGHTLEKREGWEYEQWLSPNHAVCGADVRGAWLPNSASNLTHPVQPFAAAGCFTEEHDGGTPLHRYTDHRTASRAAFTIRLLGARPDHRPPTAAGFAAADFAAEAMLSFKSSEFVAGAANDAAAAAAEAAAGDAAAKAFAANYDYGPEHDQKAAKRRPAPWFLAVGFVRPHLPMVRFF